MKFTSVNAKFLAIGVLLHGNLVLATSLESQLNSVIASNSSLLWGTYRPNLYFGTRPRIPESLATGLMWFGLEDFQSFRNIRHSCEQGDNLDSYGYLRHDGRTFGQQEIKDSANNIILTTEFIKAPGEHGGDWAVRISGKPIKDTAKVALVFYTGLDAEGDLTVDNPAEAKGLKGPITLKGHGGGLGDFEIHIIDDEDNKAPNVQEAPKDDYPELDYTQVLGLSVPRGEQWKAKDMVQQHIMQSASHLVQKYNPNFPEPAYLFTYKSVSMADSNFYAFQKVLEAPFQFDVIFNSKSHHANIEREEISTLLQTSYQQFDERFERTFKLASKGFKPHQVDFAKAAMSNMVGGIGYFHGDSIINDHANHLEDESEFVMNPQESATKLTPPMTLFSAVPSRPFFPRGFLWDEGFHQLLIGKWDNDLSLEIIKHWASLIDADGWIGREQILGAEARSKVPAEFQTQYTHYANPPTLLMAIQKYVERLKSFKKPELVSDQFEGGLNKMIVSEDDLDVLINRHLMDSDLAKIYLRQVYEKYKLNYKWFRRTQKGEIKGFGREAASKEAYRWRGRTENHTLTSGLDDYPRASPPHVGELHLDLHCWMGFMSRTLRDVAVYIGEEDDADEFEDVYENIIENLEDLHWNEEKQAYCDLTANDQGESMFVCHNGYITLFPMLLGLLPPDSPRLKSILDMMYDPDHLWSPYGLRSLSKSDQFYGTNENYWRGPIWININYLALSSLYKNYVDVEGPYQDLAKEIYTKLRKNVMNTIYKDYQKTGYIWEQYSSETGRGQRSHPFTGWSALVTLIMAEDY
ncbi:glycoside hydrolase [Basidiobolus meristosporus CBS 931.73]|uniref:Mannosyl-oligosaccharide glucosidase n=1 Tax=Basidiobolus meristosporus CBS 931.73 TaxID=1314790 RepID=A0A1Y1Y2U7_9FUNG|nr:glycoside hydrolase [Basidiobolus meristosporus CBS 931.73]|eukprot:ORX92341.1 glycoside hydrolase [Basidiobolus meristosporus CBS 931.73]